MVLSLPCSNHNTICVLHLPTKPPKTPGGPQSTPEVINHSTIYGISIPKRPQKASLVVLSLPLKSQQYPGGLQPTHVATTTLEICLSIAKPDSCQSHPCCPQPTLVASIAIAGGPQQTTVVPSHHYGGPQLTHAQHPCRHNNNLMVLCLTHHNTQEVLSQLLYPSQHSVGLQPNTVTITANLLVLSLHM